MCYPVAGLPVHWGEAAGYIAWWAVCLVSKACHRGALVLGAQIHGMVHGDTVQLRGRCHRLSGHLVAPLAQARPPEAVSGAPTVRLVATTAGGMLDSNGHKVSVRDSGN